MTPPLLRLKVDRVFASDKIERKIVVVPFVRGDDAAETGFLGLAGELTDLFPFFLARLFVERNDQHRPVNQQSVDRYAFAVVQRQIRRRLVPGLDFLFYPHEMPGGIRADGAVESLLDAVFFIIEHRRSLGLAQGGVGVGGQEFVAFRIVGVVPQGESDQRDDGKNKNGYQADDGGEIFPQFGLSEIFLSGPGADRQQDQNDILGEGVEMAQVYAFAEAAAIHGRIDHQQREGQSEEKKEHNAGGPGGDAAENAGRQRNAKNSFKQRKEDAEREGGSIEEGNVKEMEIFLHYIRGTDRVHQFADARINEHQPEDPRKQASVVYLDFHACRAKAERVTA